MIEFILGLILGIVISGVIYFIWLKKKNPNFNPAVSLKKENLQKLDKFISEKSSQDQITNNQVQDFLKVSDATATRYLEYLEQQGKIRQVGTTGTKVYYQKT